MSNFLNKDTPFSFDVECLNSFNFLKASLVSAPILIAPNWKKYFEFVCDASDYVVRVVLGQRKDKIFHPMHYASKVINEHQINYGTTEKELLAIV